MNRTVLRTVEILEIISKHGEISLADLVKITGYPKTSVYDILHALEAVSYTHLTRASLRGIFSAVNRLFY